MIFSINKCLLVFCFVFSNEFTNNFFNNWVKNILLIILKVKKKKRLIKTHWIKKSTVRLRENSFFLHVVHFIYYIIFNILITKFFSVTKLYIHFLLCLNHATHIFFVNLTSESLCKSSGVVFTWKRPDIIVRHFLKYISSYLPLVIM